MIVYHNKVFILCCFDVGEGKNIDKQQPQPWESHWMAYEGLLLLGWLLGVL